MPLTPPPDNSKALLSLAIGVSLAVLVGLYSRNTLPNVGDHLHQLPHGGYYRDGTKTVFYGAPAKLNSLESKKSWSGHPWALVCLLIVLIVLSEKVYGRTCGSCGRRH